MPGPVVHRRVAADGAGGQGIAGFVFATDIAIDVTAPLRS